MPAIPLNGLAMNEVMNHDGEVLDDESDEKQNESDEMTIPDEENEGVVPIQASPSFGPYVASGAAPSAQLIAAAGGVAHEVGPVLIISFLSLKGGVGKSTVVKALGYTLARQFGYNVLMYDCDSQRSLSVLCLQNRIVMHHGGDYANFLQAVGAGNANPQGICTLYQQQPTC
jgi:hypothetical protein